MELRPGLGTFPGKPDNQGKGARPQKEKRQAGRHVSFWERVLYKQYKESSLFELSMIAQI